MGGGEIWRAIAAGSLRMLQSDAVRRRGPNGERIGGGPASAGLYRDGRDVISRAPHRPSSSSSKISHRTTLSRTKDEDEDEHEDEHDEEHESLKTVSRSA